MNVACTACPAKYSVPDEKVRGKKVKITCKHCGTAIVVDGSSLGPGPAPKDALTSLGPLLPDSKLANAAGAPVIVPPAAPAPVPAPAPAPKAAAPGHAKWEPKAADTPFFEPKAAVVPKPASAPKQAPAAEPRAAAQVKPAAARRSAPERGAIDLFGAV